MRGVGHCDARRCPWPERCCRLRGGSAVPEPGPNQQTLSLPVRRRKSEGQVPAPFRGEPRGYGCIDPTAGGRGSVITSLPSVFPRLPLPVGLSPKPLCLLS